MSIQNNLQAVAGNDLLFHVAITFNGEPLDLTPYTPLVTLKPSATTADSGAIATFGIGTGLTYTYETYGRFDWAVPHADTSTFGSGVSYWYRVDIDNGSTLTTAMYGTVALIAA